MNQPRRLYGALALLLAAALCGCARRPQSRAEEPAVPTLTVAEVAERPLTGALTASGVFVARQEASVASELGGYRIAEVLADENQWVRRGDPLVRLDDALIRAQLAQSEANLAAQEVAAQRALAEADRVRGLEGAGVLSEEQISERRLAVRAAQAQVRLARAQLGDLKTRQDRLLIRAPASGRVLERTARPGDASAPAQSLFRIAVDGLVELDAEVAQADLGDVAAGEPATVTLPSGETIAGRVRFISPRVDAQTGEGHVRIALPVREDLRPGGFGRAAFTAASRPARVVPETAVHFGAAGPTLTVIDAASRAHRVPVKTGRRAGGLVELLEGPPVGTRVALIGGDSVLDGDPVRVAGAAQARPPA